MGRAARNPSQRAQTMGFAQLNHPTGILAPRRSKPQNAISTCPAGTITPSQSSPIKGEGSKESNDRRPTPTVFAPSVIDYFQVSPADSSSPERSPEGGVRPLAVLRSRRRDWGKRRDNP